MNETKSPIVEKSKRCPVCNNKGLVVVELDGENYYHCEDCDKEYRKYPIEEKESNINWEYVMVAGAVFFISFSLLKLYFMWFSDSITFSSIDATGQYNNYLKAIETVWTSVLVTFVIGAIMYILNIKKK